MQANRALGVPVKCLRNKMDRRSFDAGFLRDILDYDPATGIFRWKVERRHGMRGEIAGTRMHNAYIWITIGGRQYTAQQLAWLYMTGEWPTLDVDHRDGNPANDAWANLRLATKSQNLQNRGKNRNNTSGYKGVIRCGRRWTAAIAADGKKHNLGRFDTPEQAAIAYAEAAKRLHGEFAKVA